MYRAFSAEGVLVYVGIAGNWGRRWAQHSERSTFFTDVARLEVDWLASREAALTREAELIRRHRPTFNVKNGALPRRRRPQPPRRPLDLVCDRCGCFYTEDASCGWTLGGQCGDRSRDFERPCRGRLRLEGDT